LKFELSELIKRTPLLALLEIYEIGRYANASNSLKKYEIAKIRQSKVLYILTILQPYGEN